MRFVRRSLVVFCAALLIAPFLVPPAGAQDLHPSRRPSPMGMARITLDGGTYVSVVYSRPYLRGRDNIFGTEESGALVPFGVVWRTGANEATQLTSTGDLVVGGEELAAGTYSLFTTPGPEEWMIHFSSTLGLSGTGTFENGEFTPVDVAATSVLDLTVKPSTLPEDQEVDQFTISFEPREEGGADMVLRWQRTEVRVPVAEAG